MLSKKLLATLVLLGLFCATIQSDSSESSDDLEVNSKRMSQSDASKFLDSVKRVFGGKDEEIREDNDELGERRAEAFEAYEEKCEPVLNIVGKRACAPISECGAQFKPNAFNNYDPKKSTQPPVQAKPKY